MQRIKIKSLLEFYAAISEDEHIITDVLRSIVSEELPDYCKEKIAYNVPFFYGHRSICLIWPASIPYGGVREGVLIGFWYGNRLQDEEQYLDRGTNKQIFYKIYKTPEEIDVQSLQKIIKSAVALDATFSKTGRKKSGS